MAPVARNCETAWAELFGFQSLSFRDDVARPGQFPPSGRGNPPTAFFAEKASPALQQCCGKNGCVTPLTRVMFNLVTGCDDVSDDQTQSCNVCVQIAF